ncbi:MAG: universal stress protein [Deferrisomatales bacterium]
MLPDIHTILYATDLGEHAPRVFRYAMSVAQRYDARVAIVHALEPLSPTARRLVEDHVSKDVLDSLRREGFDRVARQVRERLARFCEEELGAAGCADRVAEIVVREGRPSQVILEEAQRLGADLIVMGSHGHTAVTEVLLGTTAHRVMQRAQVPVLLVRV